MSVDIVDLDVRAGGLPGLSIVTPKQITDARGTIFELFRRSTFDSLGIDFVGPIAQINVTSGSLGTLRGLHGEAMTKLVTIAEGSAFGAYLDVRPDSPAFGSVTTIDLRPGIQVLVPPGIANGFQVTSASALYVYAFDQEWRRDMSGVACNPLDPALAIAWPIPVDLDDPSMISDKDRSARDFADLRADLEVFR